ncbi:flagellar filament capping protein FliD [Halobacteriovorax sp. GB3]|uniref:flagellar filament capping protein FliD n=1 Tax=Halobacteriovorax sp. GB3 TaxID=2719615 RepID=UPI0023601D37|nr:flagellar filament capping protein FliD [Halobacteriovorax sp. GB3]MDD0854629.1 flagellar filament capping protein FliD [Halobacteriovorax sp. GB3]
MGIAFGSISTGLPKDIVKQIMAAEKIPLKNMEDRKGKFSDKNKLVSELTQLVQSVRGELTKNASARSLRELKLDFNDQVVGITADKNIAEPANYQFEVVQLAQKSSAMSSGFADKDESYIGVGYIQYTLPNGENKEIYVDSDNASLTKVAKLINKSENSGLRASVINDGSGTDTPWRLILSLEETGDNNLAEFPYFYFVDGEDDFYLEFEREAQDAKVKLDGFEIEVPENKTSDLIPGLTINLKKAKPGEEFTIKVDEDTQAISGKIQSLVDNINGVLTFIHDQNNMDENTDSSRTLGGDIMLQSLEGRLRSSIFESVETKFGMRRIGDVGITFQRDGKLQFDQQKFSAKLEENFEETTQILTGWYKDDGIKTKGFIDNLNGKIGQVLRFPDGLLQSRKRSLDNNIEQIDRRIAQKERMLEQKEKNLKDKFARLEGTIAKIKGQGAGIAGLGAAAPNPVQQLG